MLTLDFVHLELSLFLRAFSRLDSVSSAYGIARLDSAPLALDFGHLELLMSPRAPLRIESSLFIYGLSCADLSLLILDLVSFEPSLLIQGFS